MSPETLICSTQCANTMCLIFCVSNCAVCFRACAHMMVCHLQVPLCNVCLWTCMEMLTLCSWCFWYFIKLQIIVCTLWGGEKKKISKPWGFSCLVKIALSDNYVKTENGIEVSLPFDWITSGKHGRNVPKFACSFVKRDGNLHLPYLWHDTNRMHCFLGS